MHSVEDPGAENWPLALPKLAIPGPGRFHFFEPLGLGHRNALQSNLALKVPIYWAPPLVLVIKAC